MFPQMLGPQFCHHFPDGLLGASLQQFVYLNGCFTKLVVSKLFFSFSAFDLFTMRYLYDHLWFLSC